MDYGGGYVRPQRPGKPASAMQGRPMGIIPQMQAAPRPAPTGGLGGAFGHNPAFLAQIMNSMGGSPQSPGGPGAALLGSRNFGAPPPPVPDPMTPPVHVGGRLQGGYRAGMPTQIAPGQTMTPQPGMLGSGGMMTAAMGDVSGGMAQMQAEQRRRMGLEVPYWLRQGDMED